MVQCDTKHLNMCLKLYLLRRTMKKGKVIMVKHIRLLFFSFAFAKLKNRRRICSKVAVTVYGVSPDVEWGG